jgi:hypothetical protein
MSRWGRLSIGCRPSGRYFGPSTSAAGRPLSRCGRRRRRSGRRRKRRHPSLATKTGLNKFSSRITQPKSQGASQAMLYATGGGVLLLDPVLWQQQLQMSKRGPLVQHSPSSSPPPHPGPQASRSPAWASPR